MDREQPEQYDSRQGLTGTGAEQVTPAAHLTYLGHLLTYSGHLPYLDHLQVILHTRVIFPLKLRSHCTVSFVKVKLVS